MAIGPKENPVLGGKDGTRSDWSTQNKGGWHLDFKVWGLGQSKRQPLEAMAVT